MGNANNFQYLSLFLFFYLKLIKMINFIVLLIEINVECIQRFDTKTIQSIDLKIIYIKIPEQE
mgnify:CR=1 FL=1